MYDKITHDIKVTVRPQFSEEHSSPEENRYVWSYAVRIENQGLVTVQLRNRYWRITDAAGHVHEVRGAGVVGEQPILRPGEAYEYSSGTPLATPSGFMVGSYEMNTDDGRSFDVEIPTFSLDSPHDQARVH